MKFYLGVTDNAWYTFLSQRSNEDVNFWQPGGQGSFRVLSPGAPFVFKLKAPFNAIGGLGFFSSHALLPLDVAWDIFTERNGMASYAQFKQKIVTYRGAANTFQTNSNIGCIVLTDPIFFREEDWIETPENWGKSIVQGKSYDTTESVGNQLWKKIEALLEKYHLFDREQSRKSQLILEEAEVRYSERYLTRVRLGQGAFRVQLTDAYRRKCAISGEKTLPALEAAHIKPYAESGPHYISNGLLMRADLHKLFDTGYLTITSDYHVEVSGKIKETFENGKDYYKYHGQSLILLPAAVDDHPNRQYIEWHNQHIYNG